MKAQRQWRLRTEPGNGSRGKSAGSSNGPSVEARNANAVCLEPLPFVPDSILPGDCRFPKINLHKFCQNDFSVVAGPFFYAAEKTENSKNEGLGARGEG